MALLKLSEAAYKILPIGKSFGRVWSIFWSIIWITLLTISDSDPSLKEVGGYILDKL